MLNSPVVYMLKANVNPHALINVLVFTVMVAFVAQGASRLQARGFASA
jgi:hypothetical protein